MVVDEGTISSSASGDLVQRWESAYRIYGSASRSAGGDGGPVSARAMAAASWEVAAAWRAMEGVAGLAWWVVAAVNAAAQAFEVQAREWAARADAVSIGNGSRRVGGDRIEAVSRRDASPRSDRIGGGSR